MRTIGDGLASLAHGWEKRQEQKKQLRTNASIMEKLMQNNPDLMAETGLDIEDYRTMSAADKVSTARAAIMGMEIKEFQGKQKQQAALARAMSTLGGAPQTPGPREGMSVLGREGVTDPYAVANILQSLAGARQGEQNQAITDRDTGFIESVGGAMGDADGLTRADLGAILSGGRGPGSSDLIRTISGLISEPTGRQPGEVVPVNEDYLFGFNSPTSGSYLRKNPGASTKTPAPNEPWIYSENMKEFEDNLMKVEDPAKRDAILDMRLDLMRSRGAEDPRLQMLKILFPEKFPDGAPAGSAAAQTNKANAARVRRYNPKTGRIE